MTDLIFNYLYSVHEHLSDITNIRNKAKGTSWETRGRYKNDFHVNKLTLNNFLSTAILTINYTFPVGCHRTHKTKAAAVRLTKRNRPLKKRSDIP